jgi:hypothetical protein
MRFCVEVRVFFSWFFNFYRECRVFLLPEAIGICRASFKLRYAASADSLSSPLFQRPSADDLQRHSNNFGDHSYLLEKGTGFLQFTS